uniref:AarF domain-containing protein kinase 4 n=1 Tax=Cacopsylla melanoneura TaxID=428564 RepID=A0A8D9BE44_9HEMI
MAAGSYVSDLKGVLKGLQLVANAGIKHQTLEVQQKWTNSSFKSLAEQGLKSPSITPCSLLNANALKEAAERSSVVFEGVKAFVFKEAGPQRDISEVEVEQDYQDLTVTEHPIKTSVSEPSSSSTVESQSTPVTYINKVDSESLERIKQIPFMKGVDPKTNLVKKKTGYKKAMELTKKDAFAVVDDKDIPRPAGATKVVPKAKTKPQLNPVAKQRKVPSSRIGRIMSFGSLAAGLGVGTVAEATRRTLGFGDTSLSVGNTLDSAFMNPANAERIVNTLCKVRGAALKIGQILSIQDSNVISPQLQKAFERVRQSADFMPQWQVEKVLVTELGLDWRSKVSSLDLKPFAAASIGQVHAGMLKDGTEVAMKIQYPGVAQGIESDIDNLISVMKIWNVFPEGMFLDNLVEVAKKELGWEVDYKREAECTRKFKELVEPFPHYFVPSVIDELSTGQILTTELIEGVPVDQCVDLDYESRKHICMLVMELCLRELFQFRYMQTDPNWSNFFYNKDTRQLILLDFGATRSYSKAFMDQYIKVIKAGADGDRGTVLRISREMGFLTGYESKVMEEAHVSTVMILSEVFSEKTGEFDFGGQDTTKRITELVPTILNHRLCPPPEEIYSLHRKLSGVFLLCSKLKVKMACYPMLNDVYANYKFDSPV